MNRQMQPRKKATTKKYTICEAPQVAEEELLEHSLHVIKAKYSLSISGLPGVAGAGRLSKNMSR